MTDNFEKYIELIEEKFESSLIKEITSLEEKIINFKEDETYTIGEFGPRIRSILSVLINHIFKEHIHDEYFDEFKKLGFYDKINRLFDTEEIYFINNTDIRNILHDIRKKTNILSHYEEDNENIKPSENITKSTLVSLLHSISTIFQWLGSSSDYKVKFNSSIYFLNENTNSISKTIKPNIYSINEKTIKIEDHKIINIIYDKTISFNIPLYQRGYAWSKENIDDLFFDLKKRISDGNLHFFGNITFIRMDNKKSNSIIKIVDGQQRITTMLLALKAIYNKYEILNKDQNKIDDKLFSFVERNKEFPIQRVDNKITMNTLNKIWSGYNSFEKEETDSTVFSAWKEINEKLKNLKLEELDEMFSALKRLTVGVNWIKGFDEFELFESLNSKGKKLSDFDKLKNYIYSLLDEKIEKENEEDIAVAFQNLIESKFERLPKTKIDSSKQQFIIKYVETISGSKVKSKGRLFTEFKEAFLKDCENKERNIKNISIKEYKDILFDLSKIITGVLVTQIDVPKIWTENAILSPYYPLYRNLSKATGYSSVLFNYIINEKYFEYNKNYGDIYKIKNVEEFKKILKILEVWKVRRDVSHNEGNVTIGSYMPAFIKQVQKINDNFYEELKNLIEEQDGFLIMPSIETFSKDLADSPLSNKSVMSTIFSRIIEWHNNNDLDALNYETVTIIEPEAKDRSDFWNSIVKDLDIDSISTLNKIGNYFFHEKNKDFKKSKEKDFYFLINNVENDNISINKDGEFNEIPSLMDFNRFERKNEYDNFVEKRSKYFSEIAKKIFVYQ